MMKPALARGELQALGATTEDEYRKHIEKDSALERRFQPILIEEPDTDIAVEMLRGLRPKYEAHHKVRIEDDTIEAAVKLSSRYISDRSLPDKAVDLIDEASARLRLDAQLKLPDVVEVEGLIQRLEDEEAAASRLADYEEAARLRSERLRLEEEHKRSAPLSPPGRQSRDGGDSRARRKTDRHLDRDSRGSPSGNRG